MGPTGFGVTTPSTGIRQNELWEWTGSRENISSDSDQFERRVKKVHTMVCIASGIWGTAQLPSFQRPSEYLQNMVGRSTRLYAYYQFYEFSGGPCLSACSSLAWRGDTLRWHTSVFSSKVFFGRGRAKNAKYRTNSSPKMNWQRKVLNFEGILENS